jgi:hypothetical protein
MCGFSLFEKEFQDFFSAFCKLIELTEDLADCLTMILFRKEYLWESAMADVGMNFLSLRMAIWKINCGIATVSRGRLMGMLDSINKEIETKK